MATSRKKQDEKNTKTLRELAALVHNKYCFDCNQRGPTYVNVTIGTFVCTKCSGLLRGLTPPHRVKSISMATFTVEEVEFLKSRGNGYCLSTWLGLFEGNVGKQRDEQECRDFMVEKYEKKAYYNADARPKTDSFPPVSVAERSRKPKNVSEFVADFGSANIYYAVNDENRDSNMNEEKSSYANFANIINNNNGNCTTTPWNLNSFSAPLNEQATTVSVPLFAQEKLPPPEPSTIQVPSEDRYAALKDLDSAFKAQPQLDWNLGSSGSSPSGSLYSSPSKPSPTFGSSQLFPQPEVSKVSNPFSTKWGDALSDPEPTGANPFRTDDSGSKLFNGTTPSFYAKSVPYPSAGLGTPWTPNPFMNSSNPFL